MTTSILHGLADIDKLLTGVYIHPRTDDEISAEVQYLADTNSWLSFYVAEAQRMKKLSSQLELESLHWHDLQQKTRLEYMVKFSDQAVTAQWRHLSKSDVRFDARLLSAAVGFIPHAVGPKMAIRRNGVSTYSAEIMGRMGMADRVDVNRLHREALSAAGEITCVSEFLEELGKEIVKESGKEFIKEVWNDKDLQQCLLEEMGHHVGHDTVLAAAEHAVHLNPIAGQIAGSYLGWRNTGKRLDKALNHLSNAALEFHKKVFVVVAITRVFPRPEPIPVSESRAPVSGWSERSWSGWANYYSRKGSRALRDWGIA